MPLSGETKMTTDWRAVRIESGSGAMHLLLVDEGGNLFGTPRSSERAKALFEIAPLCRQPGAAQRRKDAGEPDLLILRFAATGGSPDWADAGLRVADALGSMDIASLGLPRADFLGGSGPFRTFLQSLLHHGFRRSAPGQAATDAPVVAIEPDDMRLARRERIIAEAVNEARARVDRPPNRLTPPAFAAEAAATLEACGATVRLLRPADLEQLGAEALLAVGRGSEHGAHLVVAEWRGTASKAGWDVALVGKGLTFDCGGLNLKAAPVIEKMKIDMAGAAAVLGAFEQAVRTGTRLNLVAVVPMAENMVDALSYRPGDVIGSLSGLTIEVGNTDAEGRLVLADAITLAIRDYAPAWLVDVATLTGLAAAVLHDEFGALYTAHDGLAAALQSAGERSGERLWRLPLVADQDYLVASDIADVSNWGKAGYLGIGMSSPAAGAKFLQRFAGTTRWAHIDMVGPAWSSRQTARCAKGPTGFGVRLLAEWLAGLDEGDRAPDGAAADQGAASPG